MKNSTTLFAAMVLLILAFSCKKKTNSTAITPDYSATGNPNPGNQTVTGSTTYTNPATKNSSILIGNSGWSNLTCASTNSATLRSQDGTSEVTLSFSGPATSGPYGVALTPAAGVCALTVKDPPNQPKGIVWYGQSGSISVTVTPVSITATLTNIVCTQKTFNFPTVVANGTVSCN